jgi:5-methylcytosine-specific restriction endonuclease McrA
MVVICGGLGEVRFKPFMRYKDIRRYLKPYSLVASRTTTINHAFAASIAPSDSYDEDRVRTALIALGQNPDADLVCAYCGAEAETWDHVHATVRDKKFSGYGHRIGNLLPCCKPCNSKKGNKEWRVFLSELRIPEPLRRERENRIDAYLNSYCITDTIPEHLRGRRIRCRPCITTPSTARATSR